MSDVLFVADSVWPIAGSEASVALAGLSRAVASLGHRTTVLTVASESVVSIGAVPGLARRLRTVTTSVAGQAREITLLEGRVPLGTADLLVLVADDNDRGTTTALLGSAVESLVRDKLLTPDVVVGWGETAAVALGVATGPRRLFVLPDGRTGSLLDEAQAAASGPATGGERSLAALGAANAQAIVAPSPSAARALATDPGLAARASDEPIVPIRFGSDDPPNDPSSDAALAATYSATSLTGKSDCRRAMARQASLALGNRTLLLGTAQLRFDRGAELVLAVLPRLAGLDVVVVIPAQGDREALDRARVLAIEHPGHVAIVGEGQAAIERQIRGAADAMLLTDSDDRTGRAAALAMLYGALPIAIDAGACGDEIVDCDPGSATGSGILYPSSADPFELEAAIRRAIALRHDPDGWQPLVRSLIAGAPRWSQAAVALAELWSLAPAG